MIAGIWEKSPIQCLAYIQKAKYAAENSRQNYAGSPRVQQVVIVRRGMMPPAVLCPHCMRQGPTVQYKVSSILPMRNLACSLIVVVRYHS